MTVDPETLKISVKQKLHNPKVYTQLDRDPIEELYQEPFQQWVKGKEKKFITAGEAQDIMEASDHKKTDGSGLGNRPSTLPHYKPGKAYFYPNMKIHKLRKEELVPRVNVPIRLIIALQEGISKRRDVFLAKRYLNEFETSAWIY